ncbi:MAG TPA: hypothetical protein VMT35_17500 [Ignavibacteriaceae bacterium]|nr:hypothetical protein [Ignavibacteriaceae bacterium]
MKNSLLFSLFFLSAFILLINGCSKNSSPAEPSDENFFTDSTHHDSVVVRKPNIYLYPETKTSISVSLLFPSGGTILESMPEYLTGWKIEAGPDGKINNSYDFLFYECRTPDLYQYNSGWTIERDSLFLFFQLNLAKTGFSEKEINDFIEYWIPRLSDYPFYIIYPQYSEDIEKAIKLDIIPAPDNTIRLFYVIKGSEKNNSILFLPVLPKFKREGFVAAEWGAVLKQGKL